MQLPSDGPGLPESRFVVADMLVRFDHASGFAEVLAGDPGELTEILQSPIPPLPAGNAAARRRDRRLPSRFDYERGVEACREHIRRGDAFQIVLSQRAERQDGGVAARRSTGRCAA